jgi:hypothetical protein
MGNPRAKWTLKERNELWKKEAFSVRELGILCGVAYHTASEWIKRNGLKSYVISDSRSRCLRITRDELVRFLRGFGLEDWVPLERGLFGLTKQAEDAAKIWVPAVTFSSPMDIPKVRPIKEMLIGPTQTLEFAKLVHDWCESVGTPVFWVDEDDSLGPNWAKRRVTPDELKSGWAD